MKLVSEAEIPTLPADGADISRSTEMMISALKASSQNAADLVLRWKQLSQCMDTPEMPRVLSSLDRVQPVIDEWEMSAESVSKAMRDYADVLSRIGIDIKEAHATISGFRVEVQSQPDVLCQFDNEDGSPASSFTQYHLRNTNYRINCLDLHGRIRGASEQCAADLGRISSPVGFDASPDDLPASFTALSRADFESFLGHQLLNALTAKVGPNGDSSALRDFLNRNPQFVRTIEASGIAPTQVRAWWQDLDPAIATALLTGGSKVIGALNGIPSTVRVAANKQNAQDRLGAIADRPDTDPEKRYLTSVVAGHRQLFLYDVTGDRIIEMIGDPTTAKRVITFVPGTYSNMDGFYNGSQQSACEYLVQHTGEGHVPTVGFVYKNGPWAVFGSPWQDRSNANKAWMMDRSADLAAFEEGIRASPSLNRAQHVAIGHSAGLSIVTGSEVQGTHYDFVGSLSGSWIADQWKPQQGTRYHTYQRLIDAIDLLDIANFAPSVHHVDDIGTPWSDPHWQKTFSPQTSTHPLILGSLGVLGWAHELTANHIVTGTGSEDNQIVLDAMRRDMNRPG